MSSPGRNDPCPCGSGRKFKRCCGNAAVPVAITEVDRDLAMSSLMQFATSARFIDHHAMAAELFWGAALLEDGSVDVDVDDDLHWLFDLFAEWCAFDLVTEDGPTIAEIFLRERRHTVSPGARLLLEQYARSPMRLTRIVAVDRRSSVTLADLLEEGKQYVVHSGALDLSVGDALIARLVEEQDYWRFEGASAAYDWSEIEPLLRDIASAGLVHQIDGVPRSNPRTALSHILVTFVVDTELYGGPLQTLQGEPIEPRSLTFVVLDYDGARSALEGDSTIGRAEASEGEDSDGLLYAWSDPDAEDEGRVRAQLILGEAQLVVTTLTQGAAERAQSHLEALLGATARYESTTNLADALQAQNNV